MSSKSKRFVSVFDRLGPGNDEPLSGASRRFSADKHQGSSEKTSRHSYPSDPAAQRERKTSHPEYEDKKHLHYREGSSRSRHHAGPIDHAPASGDEDRERRKLPAEGHKPTSKSSRGLKLRASSAESQGTESGGDSDREGGKRRRREGDSQRRSKHGTEGPSTKRKHDRKDKIHGEHTPDSKGRPRKEVLSPHEGHKRRKEDEYNDPRYMDRKRKREGDELLPYDFKRARVSEQSPLKDQERTRDIEGRGFTEHKRRHDPFMLPREALPRKHPRSHSPETPPNKKTLERVSPLGQLGTSGKKVDSRKVGSREKKISSSNDIDDEPSGMSDTIKKLDWDYLSNYTLRQTAKLDHSKPRSALERFSPGAIFAQVGVSLSLAGPDLHRKVTSSVSGHLAKRSDHGKCPLPDSVIEDPFGEATFASVGLSRIREQEEWSDIFKTGQCRRALTASDDFVIRRRLRKQNQSDFLPSNETPPSWESQHYSTGVALYQSLGKKASGRPAYRLQDSSVGELLVAR